MLRGKEPVPATFLDLGPGERVAVSILSWPTPPVAAVSIQSHTFEHVAFLTPNESLNSAEGKVSTSRAPPPPAGMYLSISPVRLHE